MIRTVLTLVLALSLSGCISMSKSSAVAPLTPDWATNGRIESIRLKCHDPHVEVRRPDQSMHLSREQPDQRAGDQIMLAVRKKIGAATSNHQVELELVMRMLDLQGDTGAGPPDFRQH